MPKLNAEKANQVERAEGGGSFEAFEEGEYVLKLAEVEAGETRETKDPKWVFKWKIAEGENEGRLLWEHCALTEKSMWKLKQIFEAFGVSTDTHTDDLIGKTVRAYVGQEVQQKGKNAGKMTNRIDQYYPAPATAASPADPWAGSDEEPPY